MYKMHHPNSDADRMYLPRTQGGRGLIQLDLSYLEETPETLLPFVKEHDDRKSF